MGLTCCKSKVYEIEPTNVNKIQVQPANKVIANSNGQFANFLKFIMTVLLNLIAIFLINNFLEFFLDFLQFFKKKFLDNFLSHP